MLRALAAADLDDMRPGNDVFFDIFGFFVVYWPDGWTIWIAIATLVVLFVRMRGTPARAIALSAVLFLAAITLAAIIGIVAMKLTPHRLLHPEPAIAAMWIAGVACTFFVTRGRAWQGRALVWTVIAIALAATLPGVSFLFLVPAIALLLPARGIIATAAAAILLFPLALVLYTALGGVALPVTAVLLAFVASTS
jgi:hypothetical protein